jgi:hypothetical protein
MSDNGDQSLLDELFGEVATEETKQIGGKKLGRGGLAIQSLRETEVTFGHPYDNLIQLTPELFEEIGVELGPIQRRQIDNDFDFYYMTLAVSMHPKRGAVFQLVECRLEFGPEGMRMPIVQTIFPQAQWRTVLEWGGSMNLGLNGNLDWEVGVDGDKIQEITKLGHIPSAKLKTNNELKAFIVLPDYKFGLGRSEISATGEGNARCTWRLQNPELQETQTVRFVVIFKVPKGMEMVELTGTVIAEPNMSWLAAQLDDVFSELGERFKALFSGKQEERSRKERLAISAREKWTLVLPRQQAHE